MKDGLLEFYRKNIIEQIFVPLTLLETWDILIAVQYQIFAVHDGEKWIRMVKEKKHDTSLFKKLADIY